MLYEEVEKAISANKPWIEFHDGFSCSLSLSSWDKDLDDWWHAHRIGNLLGMYLCNRYVGSKSLENYKDGLGPIYDTKGESVVGPSGRRLARQDDIANWSVIQLWQTTTNDEPHLTCFVADKSPLRNDRISTAEMRGILTLSGGRSTQEGHHHRTLIQVTVVSGTGKRPRIVVGVVNSGEESIEVRISPIVDFSKGERSKWKEWITVLSWIVGDQVGKTA